jgi:hypothetical protein
LRGDTGDDAGLWPTANRSQGDAMSGVTLLIVALSFFFGYRYFAPRSSTKGGAVLKTIGVTIVVFVIWFAVLIGITML